MKKFKNPPLSTNFQKLKTFALKRQNRQIVNKNSNEMAKGPFGKWRFWQKWRLIAKIAKM